MEIQIRRFLILGTTGGTCYISERDLVFENFSIFKTAIETGQGSILLKQILDVYKSSTAPRQDIVLYGLAFCARCRDIINVERLDIQNQAVKDKFLQYLQKIQYAALNNLENVIRSGGHLLDFIFYYSSIGKEVGKKGWGRMMRRMVQKWFAYQAPTKLIMECTKYRNRHGWSLGDVLRLSHATPPEGDYFLVYDHIFHFIIFGKVDLSKNESSYIPSSKSSLKKKSKKIEYKYDEENIKAKLNSTFFFKKIDCHLELQKLKNAEDVPRACELIKEGMLVRENVPTELLQYPDIWKTLLDDMPMKALLRNLGKLSSLNIITGHDPENEKFVQKVVEQVTSDSHLAGSRIHPLNILISRKAYSKGKSSNANLKWDVNSRILDALNEGFFKSFKRLEPTKKSYCICFDFSKSMEKSKISGSGISCREASAAIGFMLSKIEEKTELVYLDQSSNIRSLEQNLNLDEIENLVLSIPGAKNDCSLFLRHALEKKKIFDAFVIFTDSENLSDVQVYEMLEKYRKEMNLPKTKLIVVGMIANNKTLKNPEDSQMLDIVGFDTSILEIIKNFVVGKI